jgi:hypothetical protein
MLHLMLAPSRNRKPILPQKSVNCESVLCAKTVMAPNDRVLRRAASEASAASLPALKPQLISLFLAECLSKQAHEQELESDFGWFMHTLRV